MSLVCHQCGSDMRPLDWFGINTIDEAIEKLPEQEGIWVLPRVTALGWRPTTLGENDEFPSFFRVPVDSSISLCFNCIEMTNPGQKALLVPVYRAFAAECMHMRDKDSPNQSADLFDKFEHFNRAISADCLICNSNLKSEIQAPFFVCRVLDAIGTLNRFKENIGNNPMLRVADSLFGWASNYQWTTCGSGMTTFQICHRCLQQIAPRIYDDFAYGFSGVKSPHSQAPKFELTITDSVLEQLEKELGPDEARKALESMPGKVSIIFPQDEGPSKN